MPIETQTRELLHRAGDEIEVAPAPLDRLLGSAARRRRRWTAGASGVAVAALVVTIALISRPAGTTPGPTDITPDPGLLVAAAGMRLVGQGQIAVEVPESWGTNEADCGAALADTVLLEGSTTNLCAYTGPTYSALHLDELQMTSGLDRDWVSRAGDIPLAPGIDAYRVATQGITCMAASCEPNYGGAIVQPAAGLLMWVSSADAAVVNEVLDSARVIPDDYVVIPQQATPQQLRDLGVAVALYVAEPGDEPPPDAQRTDPPPGSVVAAGTTVTFFRSGTSGTDGVYVTEARAICGSLGGKVVVATAWTRAAQTVVLELVDEGEVVGRSDLLQLAADTPTRLSAMVARGVPDGLVTVRVRAGQGDQRPVLGWFDAIHVSGPGTTICS